MGLFSLQGKVLGWINCVDTHIREEKGGGTAAVQGEDHGEAAVPLKSMNDRIFTYPLCSSGRSSGCSRFNLKDCSVWGGTMLDQAKRCEEKEEQQRGRVTH